MLSFIIVSIWTIIIVERILNIASDLCIVFILFCFGSVIPGTFDLNKPSKSSEKIAVIELIFFTLSALQPIYVTSFKLNDPSVSR